MLALRARLTSKPARRKSAAGSSFPAQGARMADVIAFTGGKRCKDCNEQIDPQRLHKNPPATRCIDCQYEHERSIRRHVHAAGPRDIVIIRG